MPQESSPAPAPVSRQTLVTVWITLFLDLFAFGMVMPILHFYAVRYGASPAQAALLSSTFSVMQLVMSPVLGRLSDRFGRRPVMLISVGGSVFANACLALAGSLPLVFVARAVSGMCNANISTANAYVADRVPPAERAKYMGIMGSAIGLGFVAGPAVSGFVASVADDPARPFAIAAGLSALNWLMTWLWLPESLDAEARAAAAARRREVAAARGNEAFIDKMVQGWARLVTSGVWALVLVSFAFFVAFSAMESTFALFTQVRHGWIEADTGRFFALIGIVIFVVQGLWVGKLAGRFGEKTALILGTLVLACGLATIGHSSSGSVVYWGGALVAVGNGLISPNLNALASRASSSDAQGVTLGIVASASSLGRIVGPAIAGQLFERVGPPMALYFGAVVILGAGLLARFKVRDPRRDSA